MILLPTSDAELVRITQLRLEGSLGAQIRWKKKTDELKKENEDLLLHIKKLEEVISLTSQALDITGERYGFKPPDGTLEDLRRFNSIKPLFNHLQGLTKFVK